jgi:anaerobic selenocysteine-containing dehydrogenase
VLQEGNLALPKSLEPEQWRHYGARKNGASIVCIDPIQTRTAAASDWHLAPMSRMASSVNG